MLPDFGDRKCALPEFESGVWSLYVKYLEIQSYDATHSFESSSLLERL